MAGFPNTVLAIDSNILPMELLLIFRHLFERAQATITAHNEFNFPFLVVPPSGWPVYSNGPRPTLPIRPCTNQPYIDGNVVQNQIIKDQWAVNKKHLEED